MRDPMPLMTCTQWSPAGLFLLCHSSTNTLLFLLLLLLLLLLFPASRRVQGV
jgi:hypothetical protein